MLLVMSLLIEYCFNKVFVIVFDLIDVFPVLTEHLLLPPLGVELQSVRLLDAQLHIVDLVGLSPRLVDLRKNALLFQLQETDAVRQMLLISLY